MDDLIRKLEKATEGSEELDALIVAELNDATAKRYPPTDDFGPKNRWQFWSRDGKHFLGSENGRRFAVAPLTRSLDAALSLVPEGWHLRKLSERDDGWCCTVTLRAMHPQGNEQPVATGPLAICIAALRARHSQSSDDPQEE